MSLRIDDRFKAILGATDRETLLTEVLRFTRHLGFTTVNATAVHDQPLDDVQFAWVSNTPSAYAQLADDVLYAKGDPVAQHCRHRGVPIVWDQSTYATAGHGARWEAQAQFGYCTGIALALHMPRGQHFFIGVDRDQRLPSDGEELSRLTADLQLFAAHAQEAALRILLPQVIELACPELTVRELECLRWTMEGKSAWEVGRILSISEQTAVRHLNNATKKLDCVNKHHAIVKAMRFGLIS